VGHKEDIAATTSHSVTTSHEEKNRQIMSEGRIKRITDKGFGFIETSDGGGQDMFFHMSSCNGVEFDDLTEGQQVVFEVGHGPKGPRAENVRLA